MDRDKLSNPYRGPCIDASCQVMVYLAKRFQRRNYLEIGQSEAIWPPQAILVSDWSIYKKKAAWPNEAKLYMKHL
jgi:hypothetical protein